MATLFKELTSVKEPTNAWSALHPSGRLAILVESESGQREQFLTLTRSLFEQQVCSPRELKQFAAALEERAPWLANCSSVALLVHDDHEVAWEARGAVSFFSIPMHFKDRKEPAKLVGRSQIVPVSVENIYLLVSSSVSSKALNQAKLDEYGDSPAGLSAGIAGVARSPWRAFVFPAETQLGFINPAWRQKKPFVGFQEERLHEKKGLRFLADALDREGDFRGFRIVGGLHAITRLDPRFSRADTDDRTPGSRLRDGMLICPFGVFLLELKDWYGDVELEIQNRNKGLRRFRKDGTEETDTNPVHKLEEAMRDFKTFDYGLPRGDEPAVGGLVVFTQPRSRVTCIDASGARSPLPYDSAGKVLIGTPSTVCEQIRKFAHKVKALKLRTTDLDRIAEHLVTRVTSSSPPSKAGAAGAPLKLRVGDYVISSARLDDESTGYCDVFEAHREELPGRTVWAKRYELTSMARNVEVEAKRLAREVGVLQNLSSEPGFYRYLDRVQEGLHLYVFVERVAGAKLNQWIAKEAPSRERRHRVLRQLAVLLSKLHELNVVHRAICPPSVRVGEGDAVSLVNFDLCQLVSHATVDARGRAALDHTYLSLEATTPGAKLTSADDSFSFGKLACQTLAGRLPFEQPGTDAAFSARPALWQEFGVKAGLSEREVLDIKRMLSRDRLARPVGSQLVEIADGWMQ